MSRFNSLIALSMGALLLLCSYFFYQATGAAVAPEPIPPPAALLDPLPAEEAEEAPAGIDPEEIPAPTPPAEAVIIAVGDIMVHQPQYQQAYAAAGKTYDFSPSFAYIAPYLQESNLTVGNLETTFGGAKRGYSSYPRFNTPDELAVTLHRAGFDLLCTANNHAMDSGEKGIYRTLDIIEAAGMSAFGTARDETEQGNPLLVEVNGINIAFLAYTYGTNGILPPPGREYIVNLINKEQIRADIARARHAGAEMVIVYMHWGGEYQTEPGAEQQELARFLAYAGADIVLGSHPHVIQTMEFIDVEDENGDSRRTFVAYSLGNFISNQHKIPGAVPTSEVEYGLLLRLHLKKEPGQRAYLQEVNYLITWVDRNRRHVVIPLPAVTEAIPAHFSFLEGRWPEIRNTALRLQERLAGFSAADFPCLECK